MKTVGMLICLTVLGGLLGSAQAQILKLNYRFDEPNGPDGWIPAGGPGPALTETHDFSGNGRDGVYNDGGGNHTYIGGQESAFPTLGTAVRTDQPWATGVMLNGAGVSFMNALVQDFSIGLWIKPGAGAQDVRLICSNLNWSLDLLADGSLRLKIGALDFASDYDVAAGINDPNKWYHIGFTLAADQTLKFYVDGAQVGSDLAVVALPSGTSANWGLAIGYKWYIQETFPPGTWYDDFRVYDLVLSQGEMATLATGAGLPNDYLPNRAPEAGKSVSPPRLSFDGGPNAAAPCGALDEASLLFTKSFTLEAWIKPVAANPGGDYNAIANRQWGLRFSPIDGSGGRIWLTSYAVQDYGSVTPESLIPMDTWTHIAAVIDSNSDVSFYVNGAFTETVLRTAGEPDPVNNTDPWTLGARNRLGGFSGLFKGMIRDVRIWNIELAEGDISSRYDQTLTGSEDGLLHWFPCNEGIGPILVDHAPTANNATLRSGVSWAPDTTESTWIEAWSQDVDVNSTSTISLPGRDIDPVNVRLTVGAIVTALPSKGKLLQSDGTEITSVPTTLTDASASNNVQFVPPASFTIGDTTELRYKAWDGALQSANTAVVTLRFIGREFSVTGTAVSTQFRWNIGPDWSPGATIVITSTGETPLAFPSVPGIVGADAAAFRIDADTGEAVLPKGASRTITVAFLPSDARLFSASLTLGTDAPQAPTITVALEGVGNRPPIAGDVQMPFGMAIKLVNLRDEYVRIPFQAPLAPLVGAGGPFSVQFWYNGDADTTVLGSYAYMAGGGISVGFQGGQFFLRNAWHQQTAMTTSVVQIPGTWQHFMVSYDPAIPEVNLWVDGAAPETVPIDLGLSSNDGRPLGIGVVAADYLDPVRGNFILDDLRLWDTVLAEDVSFDAELTGAEAGLVGYYKFNEASGPAATDSSTVLNDAILGYCTVVLPDAPIYTDRGPLRVPGQMEANTDMTVEINETGSLVFALMAFDPDADPLSFTVTALPDNGGKLYQYSGGQGVEITAAPTGVTDPAGQVVFVPVKKNVNYTTVFAFNVSDGLAASANDARAICNVFTDVILSPPTGLVATAGVQQVSLAWSAPASGTPPTAYQVFRGATKIADVPATPTTYTDSDASLVAGTAYCYTVKSKAGAQASAPSNESCATPLASLNPPTDLVATGGTMQVSLAWLAPASGPVPTGYQVFRGAAKIADVAAPTLVYVDDDPLLVPDTPYCYTVKSTAGAQTSAASNQSCGTPTAVVVTANWIGGDGNGDGRTDISDAVALLTFLFVDNTQILDCLNTMELNGDSARDISDAVFLLTFLFVDNTKAPYGDPTYTSKCVEIDGCEVEDPACK